MNTLKVDVNILNDVIPGYTVDKSLTYPGKKGSSAYWAGVHVSENVTIEVVDGYTNCIIMENDIMFGIVGEIIAGGIVYVPSIYVGPQKNEPFLNQK